MKKIISCSTFARALLREGKDGCIHSVYRKTANIRLGETLLSLQTRGTPSSPLTLETELTGKEFAALELKRGMEVSFSENGFYLNGEYYDLNFVELWDADLQRTGLVMADQVAQCLRLAAGQGGFADLALPGGQRWRASSCACEAEEILNRSEELLHSGDHAATAQTLSELVGLGEGLTPSGDDFLCGLLAATWMGRDAKGGDLRTLLDEALRGKLNETNDISAAFLDCALRGQFSRPVTELSRMSPSMAAASFRAIGHSSGVDTLNGILYGLSLLEGEKSA